MAGIIFIRLLLFPQHRTSMILPSSHNTTEEIKLDKVKNLFKVIQPGSGRAMIQTQGSQEQILHCFCLPTANFSVSSAKPVL